MRAWIAWLALASGGCQKLFNVQHVDDGTVDASGSDAGGDTGSGSAAGPCTNPHAPPGAPNIVAMGVDQIAIPETQSFAIVNNQGQLFLVDPFPATATAPSLIFPGTMWSYPALSPDGLQLLVYNTDTYVWTSATTSSTSAWSSPMHATGFATTVQAGAMGVASDGTLRTVVQEGAAFREYAYGAAGWHMAPSTSSSIDLIGTALVISDPALTSDARTLVFLAATGTGVSVHYVTRTDTALVNNFTRSSGSSGTLLTTSDNLATPYLADGCALYVVDNRNAIRYDP